jgi:hypothetical protein
LTPAKNCRIVKACSTHGHQWHRATTHSGALLATIQPGRPTRSMPTIRILNPTDPSSPFCGLAHAERYVRQGRAEWGELLTSIRMIERAHQHVSASRCYMQAGQMVRAKNVLRDMAGVPVTCPTIAIGAGGNTSGYHPGDHEGRMLSVAHQIRQCQSPAEREAEWRRRACLGGRVEA